MKKIKTIVYQGQSIEFQVEYKNIKHHYFRVKNDLSIVVSTSKYTSDQQLEIMMLQKMPWILKSREQILAKRAQTTDLLRNDYRLGGQIAFLGEKVILRKKESPLSEHWQWEPPILWLDDEYSQEEIQQLTTRFYRAEGQKIVDQLNQEIYSLFSEYKLEMATVVLRPMTASWGRCHIHKGKIVLNLHLLKAPIVCLKSVMIHEYIHFIHPNHSKAFYDMWAKFVPEYKEIKEQLQQLVDPRAQF